MAHIKKRRQPVQYIEQVCGNVKIVQIPGDATIISSRYSDWKNKKALIIAGTGPIFKDLYSKVIYQVGDWDLVVAE